MALSDDQLREERRKARQMAMKQALTMIEQQPGVCSSCSKWQDDARRSCREIKHLQDAVQKMVDQLAGFMPGENLRSFLKQLQLDDKLLTIHAGGDFYKKTPMTMEAPTPNKELEDLVAERDLTKMKLGTVGRELNDLKKAHEALTKQYLERDSDIDEKQRSLAQAEIKIRALEGSKSRLDDVETRTSILEQLYKSALAPSSAKDGGEDEASARLVSRSSRSDQQRLDQMEINIGSVELQSKRLLVSPGGLKSRSKNPSQMFEDSKGMDRSFSRHNDLRPHMSVNSVGDMADLPDMAHGSYRKMPKQALPPFESSKLGRPLGKAGGSQTSLWSLGTSAIPDSSMFLSAKDITNGAVPAMG